MKKTETHGNWFAPLPLSAQQVAEAALSFQDVVLDGEDIYYSCIQPKEKGRCTIIKRSKEGTETEVTPVPFNVRTRVHEYGGAAFTVENGVVYFSHLQDQRLYKLIPGENPFPLTQPGIRLAEYVITPFGIVAIAESHLTPQVENFIALIDPLSGAIKRLVSGSDFYAFVTFNKDFSRLAWISWDHPNMPWDDTRLFHAGVDPQGNLFAIQEVEAAYPHQAFFQPQWSAQDTLMVVSDKEDWWDLYEVKANQLIKRIARACDLGIPLWTLGGSTWAFYQDGVILACPQAQGGKTQLTLVQDVGERIFESPYSTFSQIRAFQDHFVCLASHFDKPTALLRFDKTGHFTVLKESMTLLLDPAYLSAPEPIHFSSHGRKVYAYFYPPCNPAFQGPEGAKPPLIVKSHGGPTGCCGQALNLEIQYWTSRGYAYVEVNYGGSSGYGRRYRNLLKGNWGIIDVQDCEAAACFLVQEGRVSADQLAITGSSAGGYTALCALTFTDTFQVGASHYGVSDCIALAETTHKFEAHYLDTLIGPYPQERARFEARSPFFHLENLTVPVIFFQGEEDEVVPPEQAKKMFYALKEKGVKTALFLFEHEQHGFRNSTNRETVLLEQLAFFNTALKLNAVP